VAPGAERSAAARSGSHEPASPTQRPKGATRGRSATAPGHTKPRKAHKAHGRPTQPKVKLHGGGAGKAKIKPKTARPVTPATSRRPDAVKAPKPVAPKAAAPKLAPAVTRSAGAPAPAAAPRVKPVAPAVVPDAKGAGNGRSG
jgi:hypothetical protein